MDQGGSHRIQPLKRRQLGQAAKTLTQAFLTDPMWTAVLPDDRTRERLMRPMWRALLRYTNVFGEVRTTDDAAGAACWLAPNATKTTTLRMIRAGMGLPFAVMRFPRPERFRFLQAMSFIDGLHARHMPDPHWYLWALGVEPARQRQGIGTALLRPTLARADGEARPCYLETQVPGNVSFYEALGFRVVEEANVPQQPIHLWFMRRDPAS